MLHVQKLLSYSNINKKLLTYFNQRKAIIDFCFRNKKESSELD